MGEMMTDLLLQGGLFLLGVVMFLAMNDYPRKALAWLRQPTRAKVQAKRHFVCGAQLFAKARSSPSAAASAISEAEKSIALDPTDAAAHILKALALDLQGFRTSALESLDVALSPLASKSLSESERGDALLKRAELKMAAADRKRRVDSADSAAADLKEAAQLNPENAKVFCVLGECYEVKEMKEEAKAAYQSALRVEPNSAPARAALDRLEGSD